MGPGNRVEVLPNQELKKTLHGKSGTIRWVREVHPPTGRPYAMLEVQLDKTVTLEGSETDSLFLPQECFKETQ